MKSIRSLLVIALLTTPVAAQPRRETLTLDRAIEIALAQQPSVRQTRAQIEAALGRVDQAKVARRPTLSVNGSLGANSTRARVLDSGSTTTGGFFTPAASTGIGANASWRIYDFGQTRAAIRAAEANAEAIEAGIGTTTLDVQSSVAIAFLEAIARQRLIEVASETVRSEDLHVDQARRFVAAQAKDPIEVVQAQARAANARSTLAQAQSNAAVALANLRSAIGWLDPTVTFTVDQSWPAPPTRDPEALDELVALGRKHRPELVQLDKQVIAAEATIVVAKAQRRPILSASASTQYTPDSQDWSPQPNWAAGVRLEWQVFDGGRSAADQRVARANLAGVLAQRDAVLVSLTSQLDATRQQIIANRANVAASTEAVAAARAQLRLADARYTQGLGSQIELTDAQFAVTTAEGNLISAEWQLADGWAQLRRALGQW